jgi:uncharacterized protein (TIRG00374 family)
MTKNKLFFAIKLIASITACAIIFSQLKIQSIVSAISAANPSLLGLAFLLALVQPALNALKIKVLLPGSTIGYHYVLFTNFASNFFRLTIPTDFGAELGRGYYLSKRTGSSAAAFSAIIIDRYFGFCSQVLVASVVALVFGLSSSSVVWTRVGVFAGVCFLIAAGAPSVLFRSPVARLFAKMKPGRIVSAGVKLSEALKVFSDRPFRLAAAGAVSIVSQCLSLLMIVVLSAAFHTSLHFREAAVITFLSTAACLLPSFAGLGFVEGIFAGMFHYFSLHKEIGFTVSLTLRLFTIILALPGVFFIIAGDRRSKKTSKVIENNHGL